MGLKLLFLIKLELKQHLSCYVICDRSMSLRNFPASGSVCGGLTRFGTTRSATFHTRHELQQQLQGSMTLDRKGMILPSATTASQVTLESR